MRNFSEIDPIAEDLVQSAPRVYCSSRLPVCAANSNLASDSSLVEVRLQLSDTAKFKIQLEDLANLLGLSFIDEQPALFQVITEWNLATHPHAFSFRSGDLVPNALTGDFPFKLGEGKQDIQRQPTHRGSRIELLGDGDKADTACIECLDDLGKVGQAAGEAVYLIYDNCVDPFGVDIR